MAVSKDPTVATKAAVLSPGQSVAPLAEVPDNCHTLVVLNESAKAILLVGIGQAPAGLDKDVASHVPPQCSLALEVGVLSERAGPAKYVYDAIGGAATARVTYVNQFGS